MSGPESCSTLSDDVLPTRLSALWFARMRRCNVARADGRALLDQLVAAYTEPGRYYHTLRHVDHVLCTVSMLCNPVEPLLAQELAAWFHDAVHDPRRTDNEEGSAVWAVEALTRLGLPKPEVERVGDLILLTKTHAPLADDLVAQQFIDADLAILGVSPAAYKTYADGIRREYAWLADADFRRGRRAVLQRFLDRPRIFITDLMHRLRELPARANLAAEIATLTEG